VSKELFGAYRLLYSILQKHKTVKVSLRVLPSEQIFNLRAAYRNAYE